MSKQYIGWLQAALSNPIEKSKLLQQPQKLREIINDIPARQWLFEQACQTSDAKLAIQAKDLISNVIKYSRLIWRGGGNLSSDIYEEALLHTWELFNKRMCLEYKPEKASFVSWFNLKLRYEILNEIRKRAKEDKRRVHLSTDEEDYESIYPPAPEPERWHETIQEWLELVQNNSHLRNYRMQNYPAVNCQFLLIHILQTLHTSGEFSWDDLAQKYQVEASALKRFCKMRCFPIFKQLLSK
jgi:DNA-directed RNA polymerase specialized sigma24 family protein